MSVLDDLMAERPEAAFELEHAPHNIEEFRTRALSRFRGERGALALPKVVRSTRKEFEGGTTMANENPPDPAAAFRELVTTWERNLNSVANQVMGTESFSRLMQEAQRMQLALQQATSEAMGRRLTSLNMPTREDIIRLAEKVTEVDRRLARIEASLDGDATVAVEAPRAAKPRTKKPPAEYLKQEKPR